MNEFEYIAEKLQQGIFNAQQLNQLQQYVKKARIDLSDQKLSPEHLELFEKCTENRNSGETLSCPKCGGTWVVKNGHKDGRQRYLCKDCHSTFGDTYGTIFYHSKLSLTTWKKLIELAFYKQSLKTIKRDLHINLNTAWYNRHKLYTLMGQQSTQHRFHSITEGDEYYTPVSYQGLRNPQFFIEELGRMPRHKRSLPQRIEYVEKAGYEVETTFDGNSFDIKVYKQDKSIEIDGLTQNEDMDLGQARKEALTVNGLSSVEKRMRGISREQVCLLSIADREENTYLQSVCTGRVTERIVSKYLKHKFMDDAIFVTDKHRAYKEFARKYELSLRQIPADKHAHNGYSLARINSFHSRLATYMRNLKQVGSKHLDSYLTFFRWSDKVRNEETKDKSANLLDNFTKPIRPIRRRSLSSRAFPFELKGVQIPC